MKKRRFRFFLKKKKTPKPAELEENAQKVTDNMLKTAEKQRVAIFANAVPKPGAKLRH